MGPLALVAKGAGINVGGSDVEESFITDSILEREKIIIDKGFLKESILNFLKGKRIEDTVVIATAAHGGFDNPQAVVAKQNGFKLFSHGQAVGLFMEGKIIGKKDIFGISVSGSHGKTTITAMLSCALTLLGANPSFVVGTSEIFPIGSAGHFGKGNYFVAEADEYFSELKYDRTPKFLYQKPKTLIINNIDFDHPDVYSSIDEIINVYRKFSESLSSDSTLIVNGEDKNVVNVINNTTAKVITYGSSECDFSISRYSQSGICSFYEVSANGVSLGSFSINVSGLHNAKNSLAVIAFLMDQGYCVKDVKKSISEFSGTKRRMEILGKNSKGLSIVDDYAHHPEEIKKTLFAIKGAYPGKKIICVFEPHTFSRTSALMSDFSKSFYDASVLVLLPVFSSKREEVKDVDEYNNNMVSEFINNRSDVLFLKSANDVIEYVDKNFIPEECVLVTMGAGSVYKIANMLKSL